MRRSLLLIGTVSVLAGAGWAVGRAQTTVADFEITVETPRGEVTVTCSRGCNWDDSGNRLQKLTFQCDTGRCRAMFNGHGRITLGMPRHRP